MLFDVSLKMNLVDKPIRSQIQRIQSLELHCFKGSWASSKRHSSSLERGGGRHPKWHHREDLPESNVPLDPLSAWYVVWFKYQSSNKLYSKLFLKRSLSHDCLVCRSGRIRCRPRSPILFFILLISIIIYLPMRARKRVEEREKIENESSFWFRNEASLVPSTL